VSSRRTPAERLNGLYLILDPAASRGRPLVELLTEAAGAGVRLFQYRDKSSPVRDLYREALRLRKAAADAGALFLVNDRCDVALAVDADGVHLGQEDLPLKLARTLMGPGKIIGVSTHRPAEVREATEGGADYIGFGPIYPTETKTDHEPVVGVEGLRQIRSLTRLPVFAIGGITADRIEAVLRAGSDGVAIVSAITGSADISGAVRTCLAQFARAGRQVPGSPGRAPSA
jgi:thiamine-phosphate pyrophosphorylase